MAGWWGGRVGSKFFLFILGTFLEGISVLENIQKVTKVVSLEERMSENLSGISNPLT